MSGSFGYLNIQLALDSIKFQQGLTSAERKARQFSERTTQYLGNIEQAANNINKTAKLNFRFDNFNRFKSVTSIAMDMADRYTELGNKLKLVTANSVQHAQAMQSVYDISLKTSQSTQAVSSVYQTFAQNAKTLGINQQQVAEMTETVSKAVAIAGASTATAQNALTQFSQTLLMGKMKSQEFNSIMTQTPSIIQAIANGLGITTAQFKAMVDKGEMSADKIAEGLQKAKYSVDSLYQQSSSTISGAMQNLSTATEKWVGEMDSAVGVSKKAVDAINWLGKNLNEVAIGASIVAGAFVSIRTAKITQSFIEYRASIYQAKQATKEAIVTQKEQIATSALSAKARYEESLANFQSAQSKLNQIQLDQQQIAVERQKLAVQIQATASYSERKLLSAEMQALTVRENQLTQQQILLENQLKAAKTGLKIAYAENAIAQSAFAASTVTTSGSLGIYRTVLAGVKNELNLLKMAVLSNPLMFGLTAVLTAATAIYAFTSSTKEAKEEALRYADSIDNVRQNLERMTATQAAAEMVKVKQSIREQEEVLAKLRQEQERLAISARTVNEVSYDAFGGYTETVKTAEELSQANDELTLKTAEVEEAQNKLNKTLEWQQQLQAHLPVQQLKDAFQEFYPNVDITKVNFDGFNNALINFQDLEPSTSSSIANLATNILKVATIARVAAQNIALINGATVDVPQLSEKAQKAIGILKKKEEAAKLKAKGDHKGAARLEAEMSAESQGFTGTDAEEYIKQSISFSETQRILAEQTKKSGGGRKTGGKSKKDREAEKAKREAEQAAKKSADEAKRNQENYLNQVTEMSQKLAGLKAEAADIALFGQTSQYQDVKKLTEDIALNAEKYKGYSAEGIAKLKALAAQIDSETQKVAIAKFGFDNADKLKAMEFELTLLGKTHQESELLQYNYQLDQEAAKLRVGMTQENIAKLDEEIAKLKERRAEIQLQAEQKQSDPMEGIKGAWNEIESNATNVADNVKNVTVGAFNSMSDALTDFVMTGKADFRSMATSILKDISAMMIKMALFNAIKQGMSFMGYSDGGFVGDSFAVGGYTGDGGKYTPAGIVHRGEYVITKEATARLGRGYLDYLNYGTRRGFATGGGVAVPNVPTLNRPMGNAMNNSVSITINIDQNGNTESDTAQQVESSKQLGKMIEGKVLEVLATQRRAGGMFA